MARRSSLRWRIANELKGRTLREVTDLGMSLTFQCDACDRTAVWPWPWMKRQRKLERWMGRQIHDLAAKAPKLQCAACQSTVFYLRPYTTRGNFMNFRGEMPC